MNKKKLAIISSYSEACGNASYTEALRREFSKYYDVDIIRLQLDLLQSDNSNIVKLAEKHVDDICKKVKEYDYVNIQFEAGLYGVNAKQITKRVKRMIWASPNLIVTMHRIDIPKTFFELNMLRRLLSRNCIKAIKEYRRTNLEFRIYPIVAREVKKKNKVAPANIVVHTKRDTKNIKLIFGVDNVYDFPLSFLNEQERSRKRDKNETKEFKLKYGLKEDDIAIGIFGFVSLYKGHETAIRAMKELPSNYKLLIFGSQHPSSIKNGCSIDDYEEKLLMLIDKLKLNKKEKRVLFLGNLDDAQFIDALYCCDYSVLPYLEVNQSGSGIASLALETGIPSLFSNNKAFLELRKYFPNSFEQFDIGNYSELAYKILNYHDVYSENRLKALQTYNIENNIKFYMRIYEGNN